MHINRILRKRGTRAMMAAFLSCTLGTAAWATTRHNRGTAPSITTEPASENVTAGQTATFSVAANGTAPLTYQWRKNGTAIHGATLASYTTPATTTANSGTAYTVVVRNAAGSATSTAAVLTVSAAASTLSSSAASLSFGSVNVSNSSTQSVTLANTGSASVTISNVLVAGAGFSASGLSAGTILSSGQSAALSATFDPAASGNATGSITITSNAANSPTVIALSGTGVAPTTSYSVSLSWSASTSSDVTGYNVYSGAVSGGPYTKLTATPVATTSYTDSSVQAGDTYYYVVTAVNSENQESAYSAQATAVVP